jgi:hypothetical protein
MMVVGQFMMIARRGGGDSKSGTVSDRVWGRGQKSPCEKDVYIRAPTLLCLETRAGAHGLRSRQAKVDTFRASSTSTGAPCSSPHLSPAVPTLKKGLTPQRSRGRKGNPAKVVRQMVVCGPDVLLDTGMSIAEKDG